MSDYVIPQQIYSRLFSKVHPEWIKLFNTTLKTAIDYVFIELLQHVELEQFDLFIQSFAPDIDLVFEPFRYFAPAETKVVIIGQDPYPVPGDAMGLCFSVPHEVRSARKLPDSLNNIVKCLVQCGLQKNNGNFQTGDLRYWASQGVLLLNATMTNIKQQRRAHELQWRQSKFIKKVLEVVEGSIIMAWGNDAKIVAKSKVEKHTLYTWSHPSPLADNKLIDELKFKNCPHFVDCNKQLSVPIIWDLSQPCLICTDGACVGVSRGEPDSSFALCVLMGNAKKTELAGRVEPFRYELVNDKKPELGFRIDPAIEIDPTNNRGEYLAGCWALAIMLGSFSHGVNEIASDSKLFVQTINEWLPSRKSKGTEHALKNYDLIYIADALYTKLQKNCIDITITHTRASHNVDPPAADAPAREKLIYAGNDEADKLATRHLASTEIDDYTIRVQTDFIKLRELVH